MREQQFYAHGKLLLTGEYAVLDGAEALAIPTKFGQSLTVISESSITTKLDWKSKDVHDKVWLDYQWPNNREDAMAKVLNTIFEEVLKHQAQIIENQNIRCTTKLEFPRDWGLGSSSTFIYNVAKWTGLNAYDLLAKTFGGSGYDVAAAGSDLPIVYSNATTNPIIQPRVLNYSFENQLYFVYLGKKKNSREAINNYRNKVSSDYFIQKVSELTNAFLFARDLQEMQEVIEAHEAIIAQRINATKVKDKLFADFEGAVKSLGGWGGDFVLMASKMDKKEVTNYLNTKDLDTVFLYKEMIYQS